MIVTEDHGKRILLVEPLEAASLRYKAGLLKGSAERLRVQMEELEEQIEGMENMAEQIEIEAKQVHNRIVPFIQEALAEESRLVWPELETLRAALEGELDLGELLHIGLTLAIEIPAELMPGAWTGRRAA